MAFSVPPPIRQSVQKKIEAMPPETDLFLPNPIDSVKVTVWKVRTLHKNRKYMTAQDGTGSRVWRLLDNGETNGEEKS